MRSAVLFPLFLDIRSQCLVRFARHTVWSFCVALSVFALLGAGCATNGTAQSSNAGNSKPTRAVADLMNMSLPERASMIENWDPISRVETLLGEPVTKTPPSRETDEKTGLIYRSHARYYELTDTLIAFVGFADADDWKTVLTRAVKQDVHNLQLSDAQKNNVLLDMMNRIDESAREAIRNGYPDWIVYFVEVVEVDRDGV